MLQALFYSPKVRLINQPEGSNEDSIKAIDFTSQEFQANPSPMELDTNDTNQSNTPRHLAAASPLYCQNEHRRILHAWGAS